MHISEGILSAPVLITGACLSAVGVGIGLKKLDSDQIPQAGLLAAAFFVASLIHIPVGPSSAHLVLNGLLGVVLGWAAFPVILCALFLQAMLFQFGGLTGLGVNTFVMAFPALACMLLCRPLLRSQNKTRVAVGAFICGFSAVLMSAILAALALVATGEQFLEAAEALIALNSPVMLIEGFVTTFVVLFLKRVKPGILDAAYA